jgi:hypothetical protein
MSGGGEGGNLGQVVAVRGSVVDVRFDGRLLDGHFLTNLTNQNHQ